MDVDNVCQRADGRSGVFDNKKGANGVMGKIKVTPCDIKGLYVIEPAVFKDERGYFMETYNQNDFKEAGLGLSLIHI